MFSKRFLLSVIPGKLLIEVQDIYVGDTETIVVTPPRGSTGYISIDIDGITYTEPISNDTAVFNIKGLSANTYTVEAIYGSLHATSDQFTVNKIPASMYNISTKSKDIRQGTDEVIKVWCPEDATGNVMVTLKGVAYTGAIINGTASIIIPDLSAGNYNDGYAYYEGDDKYMPNSAGVNPFTVSKVNSQIS